MNRYVKPGFIKFRGNGRDGPTGGLVLKQNLYEDREVIIAEFSHVCTFTD